MGRVVLDQPIKTPTTLADVRAYADGLSELVAELDAIGVADTDRVIVYGSLTYLTEAFAQWRRTSA